jgi:ATP-dependent Clp protease ATP-binding subunit ClpC
LLQVLDDGQLTDSVGRKINFKNTVIIMTSNNGSRQLKDFGTGIGFNTKVKEDQKREQEKEVIEKELKKTFAPEFLNRIDEIITFNSLTKEDIYKIIDIELEKVIGRIRKMDFDLELSDEAKEYISEKGYDPEYGARPLKRAIQKYIEDPLTEEIIKSSPKKGTKMSLGYDKESDSMVVNIVKEKKTKKKL